MHRLYPHFVSGPGGVGLLILRLVAGTAFLFHGWYKMFHMTPDGRATDFIMFKWMPPVMGVPGFLQALAAFAEFGGGLALILGLLTPFFAFGLACTMVVALVMVHIPQHDPFVAVPGSAKHGAMEPAAVYLGMMCMFVLTGPGQLSLDALLFRKKTE